jgi:predicted nucleotidyltransferase
MSSTISKHKPIYEDSLKILIKILKSVINEKGVEVYLFGSRDTGKATSTSDIDIGIVLKKNMGSDKVIALLKEKIENSNIPYKVDVVDLSQVSESFRKQILKEGKILWKS